MWAKWLPHPAVSWAQKWAMATQPLPSWGSPTLSEGIKIRSAYLTPAILSAQKREKWLPNPCSLEVPSAQRRDKIRSGCLAVSGLM